MKNLVALLITSMITISAFATDEPSADLKIINVKEHSVYFKVDKAFIGGIVEIYSASGDLLETDQLPHTHTMIFFEERPSGKYTIKIKKGNKTVEFDYINF